MLKKKKKKIILEKKEYSSNTANAKTQAEQYDL